MGKRKYPPMKCPMCGMTISQSYMSRHYAKYHMEDQAEENT